MADLVNKMASIFRKSQSPGIARELLMAGLSTFLLVAFLWAGGGGYFLWKMNTSFLTQTDVSKCLMCLVSAKSAETGFMSTDLINPEFFRTGQSRMVQKHQIAMVELQNHLSRIQKRGGLDRQKSLENLKNLLVAHQKRFNRFASLKREIGFETSGLAGKYRKASLAFEDLLQQSNKKSLLIIYLQMRRHEKNYLLRQTPHYLQLVEQLWHQLDSQISRLDKEKNGALLQYLQQYQKAWYSFLDFEVQIGRTEGEGLRKQMSQDGQELEKELQELLKMAEFDCQRARRNLQFMSVALLVFGFSFGSVMICRFARSIAQPLIDLKEAASQVGQGRWDAPIPSGAHGEVGVLALAFKRMVDALKREATLLRQSQERFEIAARATNDVIWDWDMKTGALWFSDGMRSLAQYDRQDVDDDPDWRIAHIHPEDRDRVKNTIQKAFDSGALVWSDEYRFQRKDSSYATVFDRGFIIYDDQKNPMRMIGAIIDTSDRKRLEAVAIQSGKMSVLGQLSAGITHDLNNPLGVILGFSEILVKHPALPKELELPIKSIEREARRCKTLAQHLLAFSRNRTGTDRISQDLKKVVDEALALVGTLAQSRRVELVRQFGEAQISACVDCHQIQQLVINLGVNAMDAMPDGGTLTVSLSKSGNDLLQIQISDTGTGIPPEVQKRMFEPFFTTKELGKGTGLGLSLVGDIVKNHQGKIDVQSEVGKGTTFRITLPITNETGTSYPMAA
ncbi:MAG: ATP-binding protein [Elusimicrobiota bacterium]|jgi:PAS domain S-box-containing protein